REAAARALEQADASADPAQQTQAHAFTAAVLALLGDVRGAEIHFDEASRCQARGIELLQRFQTPWSGRQVLGVGPNDLLYSVPGLLEAEFHLLCGRVADAERQLRFTRARSQDERSRRTARVCDALLGQVALLGGDLRAAGEYFAVAQAFGVQSGVVEIEIRTYVLSAELERRAGRLEAARGKVQAGLMLADPTGFGRYAIELRLALARVELDAGTPAGALRHARDALQRATAPECGFAWAEADALDLAARARLRLGEVDAARRHLSAALALRTRLGHPGLPETAAALSGLAGA
ncbi:MAG TPA: hypothetical protein VF142_00245, partial [Longimicrobium sp.]